MTTLRPYQFKLKQDVYNAWATLPQYQLADGTLSPHPVVCAVAPTGAGKTVLFSDILKEHVGWSCAIVHRQELVAQISMTLARESVHHQIIAPNNVVKKIIAKHVAAFGKSFYVASSTTLVASVDTMVSREDQLRSLLTQVSLWVTDEYHHCLRENKWGKAVAMMPNAKGLGVTATPLRADGKGLGRHADGVVDIMVEAPCGRDLINMGYLCDYKIYAPPSDLDLSDVNVTASGDFSMKKLAKKTKESHIIGDVVDHYLRLAKGKQGITFVPSIEIAIDTADRFRQFGVAAEVVTSKTPEDTRDKIISQFAKGELQQLVNVDLFGEGFDVPAVEVVSMARATASFSLFSQQFGRALRPVYAEGFPLDTDEQRLYAIACGSKPHAIIIDHVSNTLRHGLPDTRRKWTLDAREKRSRSKVDPDAIKTTACPECTATYLAFHLQCPECGHVPQPQERSSPKQVDGDLMELTPEVLAQLRGEVDKVNESDADAKARLEYAAPNDFALAGMMKRHRERRGAIQGLRASMGLWGGYQSASGLNDREIQKKFFLAFDVDVMTAQTLGINESVKLKELIDGQIRDLQLRQAV